MSKLQTIRYALKRSEAAFDSATFRATCNALGIDPHWGYKHSALKRVVEIEFADTGRAAWLCVHHGAEALAHARHFFDKTVRPFPKDDFRGTKKLWRDFPLNLRCRLEAVFSCTDRFAGLADLEERFALWEIDYLADFDAIRRVLDLEAKHKTSKEFHRLYVLAYQRHYAELEGILHELVSLGG